MMRKPRSVRRIWPEGKDFAFTIIDDTDNATLARIRPIYELLSELGLRTTKTVWVYPAPESERWGDTDTLEDPAYRAYILDLQARGFEIALHGVRGASSTRDVIQRGLAGYQEVLGRPPRIHVNHAQNLDNLYWGSARVPRWRRALHLHGALATDSLGHEERSDFFWGDLCRGMIHYVRGLSFPDLNTLRCDPYMPYWDRNYRYVNAWFSCSNGEDVAKFRRLLAPSNVGRLVAQRGLCIVYTHFGKPGFVTAAGSVAEDIHAILTTIAASNGWFRPVSEILDFLTGGPVPVLTRLQQFRLLWRFRAGRRQQSL